MNLNPAPERLGSPDAYDLLSARDAVRPSFGEYLGAQMREGFWATTTGQGIAQVQARTGGEGEQPLTAEEWRQSKWFRPSVPFDEAMTPARAQAIAETFDANEYRRWLISQRKAGVAEGVAGFAAGIVGSIPDPVNFIPFAGPAYRAATVARFGAIGGRALIGAGEAALGTAVAQPFLMTSRQQFGDDVTFADAMLDIALSAFAGAAIGGASGVWSRMTIRTVTPKGGEPELQMEPRAPEMQARDPIPDAQTQETAGRALTMAMRDIAEGRPVDIGALPEMRDALQRIEVAGNQAAIRVENLGGRRGIDFSTGRAVEVDAAPIEAASAPRPAKPAAPLLVDEARALVSEAKAPEAIAAARDEFKAAGGKVNGFGPIFDDVRGDYPAAVRRLAEAQDGEAPGVLRHPKIGEIDLPWGDRDKGLSKIVERHPEVVDRLPQIIESMSVASRSANRIRLESPDHMAVVRLDYDGQAKSWLLTAYERKGKTPRATEDGQAARGGGTDKLLPPRGDENVPQNGPGSNASPERKELVAETDSLLVELEADPRHAEAAKTARAELARAAAFDDAAPAAARCLKG